MSWPAQPGFFGKLPCRGDFVSRRLSRRFIDHWDTWLQSAVASTRERLGAEWLDLYLTSPIWRFGFAGGLLGEPAWVGVLMPSVDKVGRYFPLTLAVPLDPKTRIPLFFEIGEEWFANLEQLALSSLTDDFDLERFDTSLRSLLPPEPGWSESTCAPDDSTGQDSGKVAFQVSGGWVGKSPSVFAGVSASLLNHFVPFHSIWYTHGSQSFQACLLISDGMPPVQAYSALLTGTADLPGWNVATLLREPEPESGVPESIEATENATRDHRASQLEHRMIWQSHGITETGYRRTVNQDAFIERSDVGLWAVADGMGGHRTGEVASAAVIEALAELPVVPGDIQREVGAVKRALQAVNERLWKMSEIEAEAERQIIGTTVVVLLCAGSSGAVLWVGDSRLYRYRQGNLEQLTTDHTLVNELQGRNWVGDAPIPGGGDRNIVTRAIGGDPILNVDVRQIDARSGDLYLLCSDGLDKELSPESIRSLLGGTGDCGERAESLIRAVLHTSARDNVTVVVVRCVDASESEPERC